MLLPNSTSAPSNWNKSDSWPCWPEIICLVSRRLMRNVTTIYVCCLRNKPSAVLWFPKHVYTFGHATCIHINIYTKTQTVCIFLTFPLAVCLCPSNNTSLTYYLVFFDIYQNWLFLRFLWYFDTMKKNHSTVAETSQRGISKVKIPYLYLLSEK